MISADAIAMMKPTAIVLNFARDLLVDEEAMVDALAAGKYTNMYLISRTQRLLVQRAVS